MTWTKPQLRSFRLYLGCVLLAAVVLGVLGVRDSAQVKLPLALALGLPMWLYLRRP